MFTLFTIPKAFAGDTAVRQDNAIKSWTHLHPDCEIMLMGDDPTVAAAAARLGVSHRGSLKTTQWGTPLLSDAFDQVKRHAKHDLILYVNTDILLLKDVVAAMRRIAATRKTFLVTGRRIDVDVPEALPIDHQWEASIAPGLLSRGKLHGPAGMDYFLFRRGTWPELPALAVGRPGWDNWLIKNAHREGVDTIDATGAITAIHQNHDYAHIPQGNRRTYEGPEADQNRALCGDQVHFFHLMTCAWVMTRRGTFPAVTPRRLLSRFNARRAAAGAA